MKRYARIVGTGMAVPKKKLTNADLTRLVDTSEEWIESRTGMSVRYVAEEGEATSDLAIPAGRDALSAAGIAPDEVDLVLVATISPDMLFPSTACLVQHGLGCKRAGAFDVLAACTGYITVLATAKAYIEAGLAQTVLVIGADTITHYVDWEDRNTCVLFGDGAGATVVIADTKPGLLSIDLGSDGGQPDLLKIPGGGSRIPPRRRDLPLSDLCLKMDGRAIFKLATRVMSESLSKALERQNLHADQVNIVIPHQANVRILSAVAERLGIGFDRWMINIEKYGNTTAATIPIALHEALQADRIKSGDLVAMVAFGGGLTWGTVLARW